MVLSNAQQCAPGCSKSVKLNAKGDVPQLQIAASTPKISGRGGRQGGRNEAEYALFQPLAPAYI
jgi:hypothetical protein